MDKAIAYHESLAASWDARYEHGGFKRRAAFFEKVVLPRLDIHGRWLDLGCGTGYFSRILAARGALVHGIDGSPAMIAVAKAKSKGDSGLNFAVKPIEAINYPPGSFDGAISLSVIEYLADPAACLMLLARVTATGGQLVFSVPNRRSALRSFQRALFPLLYRKARSIQYLTSSTHQWSLEEVSALAERSGWICEGIVPFDPVLPRFLFPILRPSLFFVVARRNGGGDSCIA